MVLLPRNNTGNEMMLQTVPTAFTPPFDYTNFADSFDLSLLPEEELQPVSPSTQLYSPNPEKPDQPKIFTTYYPSSPESESLDFAPDFNKLLSEEIKQNLQTPIYLDVPTSRSHGSSAPISPHSEGLLSPSDQFLSYRDNQFYPSSPEYSVHTPSPGGSIYSKSPCDELLSSIKRESPFYSNSTSPLPSFSPLGIKEEHYTYNYNSLRSPASPGISNYSGVSSPEQYHQNDVLDTIFDGAHLEKDIKQESTVDFNELLNKIEKDNRNQTLKHLLQTKPAEQLQIVPQNSKDHQLLRSVLRDTSFQKKHNLKPIDFPFPVEDIKMEQCDENHPDLMEYSGQITRETIDPVLNLAIEQMRKDVDNTCSILGISADPAKWSETDVLSWLKWTSQQYGCAEPATENWHIAGQELLALSENDFMARAPEGGMIFYAQLEIWKAAYSDQENKKWIPESVSSNASSGDVSEDEDEESQPQANQPKPTTSRGGSHIHLWQFLKDLLANPDTNGTCIRWLDRSKGVFKIEDSVKVARLWGKRKNRPAMNYDKLSRSIRQYYKKGIMKKTERSQRLVYQFCHPYCL